jgi:hypothetical protein
MTYPKDRPNTRRSTLGGGRTMTTGANGYRAYETHIGHGRTVGKDNRGNSWFTFDFSAFRA